MSQIFLSWGSPDKTIATALAERLKSAMLDVFFSDIDMHAGDDPKDRVLAEIDDAVLSIFALSNESVSRDWVMRELTLAWRARRRGRMRRVIPLVVGPLDDDNIPGTIDDEQLHRADFVDLTADFEERLEGLITTISEDLKTVAPVVVPAALFAMTSDQFEDLCTTAAEEDVDGIIGFLRISGARLEDMEGAPLADKRERIRNLFEGVYKKRSEDFDPFRDGGGIRALLTSAQRAVNQRGGQPVYLRWDDERLRDVHKRTEHWFQRDRKRRSCLTIVDSLSVFHGDVRDLLAEMPRPDNKRQDGLLWIPPFRSVEVDRATEILTATPRAVLDAFVDWTEPTGRWVSFNTSSPASLKEWAVRAVNELGRLGQGTAPPEDRHLQRMLEEFGRGPSPRDMYRMRP